ncbi:MAG: FRG domain-containing protein [Pusillimonas sp.]
MNKIENVSHLIEAIKTTEGEFNSAQMWFRGLEDASWELIPSIHRKHKILEAEYANRFRLNAPAVYSNCPSTNDYSKWLPLMQHYGLPTRLLDWSESPLIALFFAIESKDSDGDRALWMLAPGKLNEIFDFSVIPFLNNEKIQTIVENSFNRDKLFSNIDFLAVAAPLENPRMSAQMGHFTIHNTRDPLNMHPDVNSFLKKYIIPYNSVQKIRTELNMLGIRRSKIFPDLTNLAKEISEIVAIE